MKSVFIVLIVAIVAYFLFRPTTFMVKNDIFMYKLPEDVYEFLSDLKRTIEKHSSTGAKCTLVKQRTRKDGVKEKLYLMEKAVPLFWGYEFPLKMEIRLTLSKPSEEILYNFGFLRGYLLKVHSRMTFEQREGRVMPGTFLTESLTVTCPWLAQTMVEKSLKDSHKDALISLRNGLEGMPVSRDKRKQTGEMRQEEGEKMRTERKKEAVTTDKKAREGKKDDGKKSSGQEAKASRKVNEQEKSKAPKQEKRQAVDETKTSKDADVKARRAEKEGEGKKESKAGSQEKSETVTKHKKPTTDAVKAKQAEHEKTKKAETREEGRMPKDVKTEKKPGKWGTKEKEPGKRTKETDKAEKKSTGEDAREVKRDRKRKETVQKASASKEGRRDGKKEKIVNHPVKSEQKQNAKTGGQR